MEDNLRFPEITIIFNAYGNDLDLNNMTKFLNVEPTKTRKKEDWPEIIKNNTNLPEEYRPKNQWKYEKDFYELYDLSVAYKEILDKFNSKTILLKEIGLSQNVKYSVILCIDCYRGELPAMVVDSDMIHFLSDINAEISFDIITVDRKEGNEN